MFSYWENRLNIQVFTFAICLTVTQFVDSLIYTPLVQYTHLEFLLMLIYTPVPSTFLNIHTRT